MAKRNLDEYAHVLTILENGPYADKDGFISLSNIEDVFRAISDKSRPNTIRGHIQTMCHLNLIIKKGELSYKIRDNWREIVKLFD